MRPGLLPAALALPLAACSLDAPPPDVLVVVVDDLRADALRGAAETPHVDRLRDAGLDFRTTFAHTPSSLDGTATLLSGRLPHETGVWGDERTVDADLPLLTETLGRAGYVTYGAAGLAELRPQGAHDEGPLRGFAAFETPATGTEAAVDTNRRLFALLDHAPTDRPWFLYVHYTDPAAPYAAHGTVDATAEVLLNAEPRGHVAIAEHGRYEAALRLRPGANRLVFRAERPLRLASFACGDALRTLEPASVTRDPDGRAIAIELANPGDGELPVTVRAVVHDVPTRAEERRRYFLEIEAVDRALGALVAELERRGRWGETLVVFTSTHGTPLGQHLDEDQTGGLYDELLRVPLVLRLPAGREPSRELIDASFRLARHVDVAPTLLELLELDAFATNGRPLGAELDRVLTAEARPPQVPTPRYAKRNHRYKLIYAPEEQRFEMYDLARDPLELDNVFAVEGHLWIDWQAQLRALAEHEFSLAERADPQAAAQRARVLGY